MTLLLENGHDPDPRNADGQTPLLWAAKNGHEALVELLLQQTLDVKVFDESRRTAWHYAANHGWIRSANLLLESGADVEAEDSRRQTPLLSAAARAQTQAVHLLVKAGANTKALDAQKRGALHLAVGNLYSSLETVELLILRDAPTDTADVDNMTPLHYTVRHNRQDFAELLIQNGVPLDIGVQRKIWKRTWRKCNLEFLPSTSIELPFPPSSEVN